MLFYQCLTIRRLFFLYRKLYSLFPQIAHHQRAQGREGFLRLMRGTQNRAYLFIGDSGFDFPMPRVLTAQGVQSPREYCEEHDIPFLVPFTARSDLGLQYDHATHRLIQVPADEARVRMLHSCTLSCLCHFAVCVLMG